MCTEFGCFFVLFLFVCLFVCLNHKSDVLNKAGNVEYDETGRHEPNSYDCFLLVKCEPAWWHAEECKLETKLKVPVNFSSRWYLGARKSPYALHPVSQKFLQCCIWNSSSVRLIDDGTLSSFQGRSSSVSSLHASLLQAIDGVFSLILCPQVVSQTPQHFRFSENQSSCDGCFSRQSICSVVSLHSNVSRAVTHRSFRRCMSTIDTFQSGLPIPHFKL